MTVMEFVPIDSNDLVALPADLRAVAGESGETCSIPMEPCTYCMKMPALLEVVVRCVRSVREGAARSGSVLPLAVHCHRNRLFWSLPARSSKDAKSGFSRPSKLRIMSPG